MKKKYLFIPVMPTPNGRFHIGHISGPYLKMDVLARYHKSIGNEATIISGVDTYESHVCLKALEEESTATSVNEKYHQLMLNDLKALNIQFDQYINPLSEEHKEQFDKIHTEKISQLIASNKVKMIQETFLKNEENEVLSGCWIRGKCSYCNADMKAFFCEDCGSHIRPENIVDPYFYPESITVDEPTEIKENCWYLKTNPKKLREKWNEMKLPERFKEISETFLNNEGEYIRLTSPSEWGIKVNHEKFKETQVLFSYTSLLFYALYCGELYQKLYNENPFDKDSTVTTVASFGIDNTNSYLVGVLGGAFELGIKPFDHFLTNYFLSLNNKKVASSTGHVIWGEDIVKKHKYPSDAVRYFLLKNGPHDKETDFDINKFDDFFKTYYKDTLNAIGEALRHTKNPQLENDIKDNLALVFEEYQDGFSFPNPDFNKTFKSIENWIACFDNYKDQEKYAYSWLLGLAVLLNPVMPNCSKEIFEKINISEKDAVQLLVNLKKEVCL